MERKYSVGGCSFRIECDAAVRIPAAMDGFETKTDKTEYSYRIHAVRELPKPVGRLSVQREDLKIYTENGRESRLIGIKGSENAYALYTEVSDILAEVYIEESYLDMAAQFEVVFVSLLALERRMAAKDVFILHCSYSEYQGKALLFSAPSETGKTTQAGLWEKYRHSRVVNGDKALILKTADGWKAAGWPISGTSGVCRNETFPVGSVVILSQAKENKAEKLNTAQAFTGLYGQVTVNRWNRQALLHNIELLEAFAAENSIYHLACDISENAVICLENAMKKNSTAE